MNLTFPNVVVLGKENKTGTIPKMRKVVNDRKFYLSFHISKLEIKQNKIQVIALTITTNKNSKSKASRMAPWWGKAFTIQA